MTSARGWSTLSTAGPASLFVVGLLKLLGTLIARNRLQFHHHHGLSKLEYFKNDYFNCRRIQILEFYESVKQICGDYFQK
jgi:hypothetical protein